jgi:hypothetical protein
MQLRFLDGAGTFTGSTRITSDTHEVPTPALLRRR